MFDDCDNHRHIDCLHVSRYMSNSQTFKLYLDYSVTKMVFPPNPAKKIVVRPRSKTRLQFLRTFSVVELSSHASFRTMNESVSYTTIKTVRAWPRVSKNTCSHYPGLPCLASPANFICGRVEAKVLSHVLSCLCY